MIKAPALRPGNRIGFFSPSSAATAWAPVRFARAKAFLEGKGFQLEAGSLCGRRDFYRSGSIRERADELNRLLRHPDIRCIMSTIGGSNSNALLPYLDYEALKRDPKIIIGYSDATALLFGIYAQTGLVTFYGPALVASFGELGDVVEQTFTYFSKMVMDTETPVTLENPAAWTEEIIDWETQDRAKFLTPNRLITVQSGIATGRLLAGNLSTMSGIYGSPYMPDICEGDILVLEDSLKGADIVERLFAHLKINGVFDRIGGLVLGKHEKFNDLGSGRRPVDILQEVMGPVSFPVLAEFDCAHTHPMITLPIGMPVQLDADAQTLTVLEPGVMK